MKRRKNFLTILLFICCFLLVNANNNQIKNNKNNNKIDEKQDKSDIDLNDNKSEENDRIVINRDNSNGNQIVGEDDHKEEESSETFNKEDNEVIETDETVDDIVDEEIAVQLTEKEREAISLYENALLLLNSSRPDRKKAYNLLIESAKLDHEKAQEMVAKSHLFGDYLPIDVEIAKQYFSSLSLKGNSNAQMVC